MANDSYEPQLTTAADTRGRLTPEQQDTAQLLQELLGNAVAHRYIDFCELVAGGFGLRVSSPMAAHALREMDSIFRDALDEFAGINPEPSDEIAKLQQKAAEALRALGKDEQSIAKSVRLGDSHKVQIKKIVSWLGLAEDGDVAEAWLSVSRADSKAHERKFARSLIVDDEFRKQWAEPFDMVIRGVATALQGKFTALIVRAGNLAHSKDAGAALAAFEKQNIGAMTVQWHFYRNIDGPHWLPELINRKLLDEPVSRTADDTTTLSYRDWPVGNYLIRTAKGDDKQARCLLVGALRSLANAKHPDVRRDGLEVIANLPAEEAAELADVAAGWLTEEVKFYAVLPGERLLLKLAAANQREATLVVARALLRLFDRNEHVDSLFSQHMYEHSLPKIEEALTNCAGLDALKLLTDLLYQANLITRHIRSDPPQDYSSISSFSLPNDGEMVHDIPAALAVAVRRSANRLVKQGADVTAVTDTLLAHRYNIFERIALHTLALKPEQAPSLANQLLLDQELLESSAVRDEYGALAMAWYPQMTPEQQTQLLTLVDAVPEKYLAAFEQRFSRHRQQEVTAKDIEDYRGATTVEITWRWRSVLPQERRDALAAIAAAQGEPDAWRSRFDYVEQSPRSVEDFAKASSAEIVAYLKDWAPPPEPAKETKSALGMELRNAVQRETKRFSADAAAFLDLPAYYVRRFLEGLRYAEQNKAPIEWEPVLGLVETVISRVDLHAIGDKSADGEDPSWFWAAKEGAELVQQGLRNGKTGIPYSCAKSVAEVVARFEKIAPVTPEIPDFDEQFNRQPYFTAQGLMLGMSVELVILRMFWMSKHDASPTFATARKSMLMLEEVSGFMTRQLAHNGQAGKVVRVVIGRYLNWLLYFWRGMGRRKLHCHFFERRRAE